MLNCLDEVSKDVVIVDGDKLIDFIRTNSNLDKKVIEEVLILEEAYLKTLEVMKD